MWPPTMPCWVEDKRATFVSERQAWSAECSSAPTEQTYDNFTQDAIILSLRYDKSYIPNLATLHRAPRLRDSHSSRSFLFHILGLLQDGKRKCEAISTSWPRQIVPWLKDTVCNFTAGCRSFADHDDRLGACPHRPQVQRALNLRWANNVITDLTQP